MKIRGALGASCRAAVGWARSVLPSASRRSPQHIFCSHPARHRAVSVKHGKNKYPDVDLDPDAS